MTIREAIALADAQSPNAVERALKIRWLSELDGRVDREILSPDQSSGFTGYGDGTSEDTVLKVAYPYDSIYPTWLMMHIARMNGEMQKYNDGAELCNELLTGFRGFLARTTRTPARRVRYF